MIRVVIVDDEALVRTGFSMILNATDDIRVVGTASGIEALDVIKSEKPDVLLLDIRMPQVDGLTLLSIVSTLPERPAVAMLTTFDADEYIMTALGSGASGFLLKDTEPEQLGQYVRALAAGGIVLSSRASRPLLNARAGLTTALDEEAERVSMLTDRERQVLMLVAEGLSNADIGARLYLGAGTVKDHVSAILAKLGVTSRVQAALAAQRAGLLDERLPEQ
ncbi:MAG: DNA-binding response regulator [Microbacterium sp. 14-71-5]|jgi:DNA-binding NarL/FixJ family response regulator|uniref:response regulator n=1 Tax=Microbacterium sp. 13-71-7 TaxID=1970399 RepID=UPI000BC59054|nr:response regulator transcription factor [Microbacterium sp. 13-71-7]OZB84052.1 MAG: DNA-binding response regulator [Microbacterium sp. 13-71-7]OZB88049.1 MAG: DNA-binding response regulator [Microbacterium sp. 14-71-5]